MAPQTSSSPHYPDVLLHVAGEWRAARDGATTKVLNPATEEVIGSRAHAGKQDVEEALAAAQQGFADWTKISVLERSNIMRKAASLLRDRVSEISVLLTMEQGKPLAEARAEILSGADIIDWFAEEARRTYGRVIPARRDALRQLAVKEPVGPVAAFAPWNFPINQVVRKVSAALAAGCSIIVKGPDETPASPAALIQCFVDAGIPAGAIALIYGTPAEIANQLITSPVIRKISFTGSTAVGKTLAALAGSHMKRSTMELGGHAPAMILKDADLSRAASVMAAAKFRNAGQACISPTRFLIDEEVYEEFVSRFVELATSIKVANGLDDDVTMGPLANARRLEAMDTTVQDAVRQGAKIVAGGKRSGNKGYFFEPTVLRDVPVTARAMNEEPFGPVALMTPVASMNELIEEANRLDYGLASYAFTRSAASAARLGESVRAGMLSINHYGLALPEVPFGGINDSGYGTEGGADALEGYLNTKFISHLQLD
ncbi:NAD-dependent succinate-semialdehyde dehydrogenase [Agrobacterium larrymoorei]|uniref:NAD-dependent succinate-semialdehyde dehydrogenase n=1 Tax=Agrobacterium larrymoorei TaxID=160699 RepID=A0AAF0HDQ5_9HYPH|nr:NAD-dependent succinate-semialdehyde dehydrogenase [Agrobacterium larrymoorei]WHA43897.1 NAD-dependent succinate-semialdehyde dehydrogenase [Agrobacterium larrymoorei]